MPAKVAVIVNPVAGAFDRDDLRGRVQRAVDNAGIDATIEFPESPSEIEKLVSSALKDNPSVIVAGGGDGTISAVASRLAGSETVLGILPLGTLNHFSKDLGIPQEINEALDVVANGTVTEIDIGEVNGRYFINNSSIGLYPRIVRKREQQQRLGRGKWWAAAWATWRMFVISPFLKIRLDLNGNELRRKTPFVFVGNNDYDMDIYNIGRRARLDDGNLSIYLLRRSGRFGLFLLILHTLLGRLQQLGDFEEFRAAKLSIATRRKRMLVALDGEVTVIETPLEYRIHPKKLKVMVPVPKER
jgi:YegS/Rv2252/BmrU family lipid kinase